jgi:hypothetical protein
MKLACSLCNKTLAEDGPYTASYGNAEAYLFCSRECGDEWSFSGAPEKDSENEKEAFISGYFHAQQYP